MLGMLTHLFYLLSKPVGPKHWYTYAKILLIERFVKMFYSPRLAVQHYRFLAAKEELPQAAKLELWRL